MHNDIDQFPFHSQTACLRPQVENDLPIIEKISNSVYIASGAVSYTHLTLPTKRIV